MNGGSHMGWGGFWLRDRPTISRRRCDRHLRWQLITDRKSYMCFRLQQKLMTLNDLKRQFAALTSELCGFHQTAEATITRFCCKVSLYVSYLHIKFDDELKGNPFDFQAYFPIRLRQKLNWRLNFFFICFICTEICNTNLWQRTNVWQIVVRGRRNVDLQICRMFSLLTF